LISKLGLDGHDVGVKVLAAAARDAGHEVIYLGILQTAASVTQAALDEDVDLVAVSLLSGAHSTLMPARSHTACRRMRRTCRCRRLIPIEDQQHSWTVACRRSSGPASPALPRWR
jgi:methylmalonyl-CoA mutase cobalamin-binding domain/chain